ncbi:radical SAM protein [Streptomyces stramineus]
MNATSTPAGVIWDITYACPLRCSHCYSESGRRPSPQPTTRQLLRMADAFLSLRPRQIVITGGEPLLVPGLFDVAARFSDAGVPVTLYTSGWRVDRPLARELLRAFPTVAVSLDGATAEVHDRIRGRALSYARATNTLRLLDEASRGMREQGAAPGAFGVDVAVMRSNLHQIETFCTTVAPRFPELGHLVYTLTLPAGLAAARGLPTTNSSTTSRPGG